MRVGGYRWAASRRSAGVVGLCLVGLAAPTFAFVPAVHVVTPAAPPDEDTRSDPRAPSGRAAGDPGSLLPAAPDRLETELPPASTERIRLHLEAGDTARALRDAERLVAETRWGRERDAAWMVVGLLHREAGLHNLASDAFTKVRSANGPLASEAAFFEAEQDLFRGREWSAIKECEKLRATWPDSPHAGECLRVIARGHAQLGNGGAARAAAALYDEDNELGTISEQVDLALAVALTERAPAQSVALLKRLATIHEAPLTGRVADEQLAKLAADGVPGAALSTDPDVRMLRAISMRDSGRMDEAWAEFEALAALSADEPRIRRWVEDNFERFGWRTRRWDALAEWYGQRHAATGSAEEAWNRYRALVRGSRFDEAAAWALEMQPKHAATAQWRRSHEEVGRTMMLAGRYAEARDQFDKVAARGGWTGRRAAFSAGFAALMSADAADAVKRFDPIVAEGRQHALEARYWRARAHDQLEQTELAAADRAFIAATEPWSWYGVLVRQRGELPQVPPFARDGGWPGLDPAPVPASLVLDLPLPDPLSARAPVGAPRTSALQGPSPAFARVAWGAPAPVAAAGALPTVSAAAAAPGIEPPASYRESPLYDPASGRRALYAFAEANADTFPELRAIADLASVGLYDLSGPRMSAWFEELEEASRRGVPAARRLYATPGEVWRPVFLGARDHHHTARYVHGLWELVAHDPSLAIEAWRLGYPLAHDRYVWTHAREHDVDPLLVLGLMRQESTYDSTALSRAGARGAMQIMPRTGHLLADLRHDTSYTASDLEDPTAAVGYGITYLGMLLDRFDGVYPLAVASYNGGPFNVSSWLSGTGADMPMDVFVEHIPFKETRDYVKKVTEGYAAYVALYAPEGSAVVVPPHPLGDHPEVVDF